MRVHDDIEQYYLYSASVLTRNGAVKFEIRDSTFEVYTPETAHASERLTPMSPRWPYLWLLPLLVAFGLSGGVLLGKALINTGYLAMLQAAQGAEYHWLTAERSLGRAEAILGQTGPLMLAEAKLAQLEGDPQRELDYLSRIEDYRLADTSFERGRLLWLAGEQEAATAAWVMTAHHDHSFPANLYISARDWGQEITGLDEARFRSLASTLARTSIESGARAAQLYNIVGSDLRDTNRIDEAIAWFERADREAQYGTLWHPPANLAAMQMERGQYEEATQWWLRAIEKIPTPSVHYYFGLGESYEAQERWEEALDAYSEALRLAPDNVKYRESKERVETRGNE